ncbi:phosphoenolpyruvate carboxylase [Piscinibacter aquaticus]|uniref:Phosphoenolpyruvate carboxylase n=1 Tax=Piscinibacter aquaticus TaxID=392597 RepID=A0A5C6U4H1_9BURK|nr:phosphoenolpyruvate carboxylase [Piscinibacter aquaticus]
MPLTDLHDADESAASIESADALGRAELLRAALLEVLDRHEPEAARVLRGEKPAGPLDNRLLARTIQAQAIWFQLLAIAEQNRDMRRRREVERQRGHAAVAGTFAHVFQLAAAQGFSAAAVREALCSLRVRPVITAHPTEARRVTVLERHRRIYLRLFDLESPRWTERERDDLQRAVRDEIEVLWLTGELKLDRPTIEQEVDWGLYFFEENLFDAVPALYGRIEAAFAKQFPGEPLELPVVFGFGSWIGGDRDGNPFVTSTVTRNTLWRLRLAALRRYRTRLHELARQLSVSERALPPTDEFRVALDAALAASGDGEAIAARNPGELFRQFLACMKLRVEASIASAEARETASERAYASADALIADLELMYRALVDAGATPLAQSYVAPLLREVRCFRFATARLDVRENAQRIHATLAEVWKLERPNAEPPAPDSPVARLAAHRTGRAPDRRQRVGRDRAPQPGSARDHRHLSHHRRDAPPRRAGGGGLSDPVDDAPVRRCARRLPAGQARRPVPRHRGGGALHAAGGAAAGDHPRPATRGCAAEGAARRAAGAAHAARPGQRAGGDDRLLRFEQGWRLPHRQLGALQGAGCADPAGRDAGRAHRLLPRPRRFGESRRRAHRPGHRRAAGRLHPRRAACHRAGRGGLGQVRQPRHRALPGRTARSLGAAACAGVGTRGGAGAAPRIRRGDRSPLRCGLGQLPQADGDAAAAGLPARLVAAGGTLAAEHRLAPGEAGAGPRHAGRPARDPLGLRLTQNRHMVPGWYGLGSALEAFVEVRKARGDWRCCSACSRNADRSAR